MSVYLIQPDGSKVLTGLQPEHENGYHATSRPFTCGGGDIVLRMEREGDTTHLSAECDGCGERWDGSLMYGMSPALKILSGRPVGGQSDA